MTTTFEKWGEPLTKEQQESCYTTGYIKTYRGVETDITYGASIDPVALARFNQGCNDGEMDRQADLEAGREDPWNW
jgi:hypothetical protein